MSSRKRCVPSNTHSLVSRYLLLRFLCKLSVLHSTFRQTARSILKISSEGGTTMPGCYLQTEKSSSHRSNLNYHIQVEMRRLHRFPRGPLCILKSKCVLTQAPFGRLWDHNIDLEPSSRSLLICITGAEILDLHDTGWVQHNLHPLPFEDALMICFGPLATAREEPRFVLVNALSCLMILGFASISLRSLVFQSGGQ